MKMEALKSEMITAMKAHDKERKESISCLIAAIKKVAIDEGLRDDIPEEMVDTVLLKEVKRMKEQVDSCPDARTDLKAEYEARYKIFLEFVPKMMSQDEIEAYLKENFAEVVASKNKGNIMKSVMGALKGKADGKDINAVVAKLCQ
ncbi:MAG TPA: GatB/YqeY domain-containing protein [Bacillota bacterium]|nr:GatB/YqeY domain-containing protein [Bacillota bacterium]HPE39294.1 GatB/YqeY domain-containing protein [Bacillota bacterium]